METSYSVYAVKSGITYSYLKDHCQQSPFKISSQLCNNLDESANVKQCVFKPRGTAVVKCCKG